MVAAAPNECRFAMSDDKPPGFVLFGIAEWGMLEGYDTVGNDGMIPAPGNASGAYVPYGRFNGVQTSLFYK